MSIDIVKMCPMHGRIDAPFRIGSRDFCEECLADKLVEIGVSEAKMQTIDREREISGSSTECECCGAQRPDTQDACPVCGHQPPRAP